MSLGSFPRNREKTIGVCMIVKNEAHVITRCLDSVQPLIDYVLVEDTGSTDGTQAVIQGWMRRNDIPGLVIDEPWRDFAYNRSHALEALRKVQSVDYALIIDADDQLVLEVDFNPTEFKKRMRHDLYEIQIRQGELRWWLPHLCSNTLPYYFIGVLHEVLVPLSRDTPLTKAHGFYVIRGRDGRDGSRNKNPHKYRDDAATLEKALLTEVNPSLVSRYTFYLAQSYRDCGEREKALTNYLKRAQLGLWTQETFYSLYQAGMLQESLGFPPEEVLATYSRASDVLPSRAEALHAAARHSRSLGNYEEGYQYAKRGSAVRMPEAGMFTVSWIYDYGLLEELARNAFCIRRYQECIEACRRLLHEGKLPADMRADLRKIANFAAGAIAGFYIVPNRERPASDKYRKDTEVLEEALRAEDDAFLRARYTFYLALSLNNDGEREKALATSEEAVRLHRELEGHNRDAILPDLASALSNLSQRLSDFDRREEALAASQEAVKLYRKLEGHIADAFLPEFAAALDNLSKLSLASCDTAIALAPDLAPAHANRGGVLLELRRFDEALASCDKAIALAPDLAQAHANRGGALVELKRFDEALASCDKAIALKPDLAQAHTNRGGVLLELKRFDEALASCDTAIALAPDFAQAHANRGGALVQLKRFDEALVSCDKAIALAPDFAQAHTNRGGALVELKRFDEALASCDKVIALKPDFAQAHANRGGVLLELRRFDEALVSYDKAIALAPDFAQAHTNRGGALVELKRFDEALASCDKVIALKPDFAQAHANRGWVLVELRRFDEALVSCDKAIALAPDYLLAWLNSGQVYFALNRKDKAVSCLEKAIELDPSDSRARFASCIAELPIIYREESEILESRRNYERKLRSLCDAHESEGLNGDLGRAISAGCPFFLAYQGYCDLDLQTLYGSLVCKIVRHKYSETTLPAPPAAGKPVRVGFVSSFFWNHSNWKIPIKGWISQLDRRRFQIFGYHVGKELDGETAIAASMCDRFVHGLTTVESWRNEILADAPHVLVYPGLLMEGLTLQLAAQRLAPVQCNSLGHPETSGMPTLDFFISSDLMEPDEASKHYSETLVRLPNLSVYYEPRSTVVETKRSEFGLRPDATVFWCGQSLFKYLPQYDFVFADIAARVDNCQFVFVRHVGSSEVTKQFTERLDRAFQLNGLDYSRYCVFLPRLNPQGFITAIGQCDLILDSIGWSGFNSTLESLECDLPIVTFRGSLMRGRHTAAILQMMGVINTIATTFEDYVSVAVKLANNPAERAAVSRSIADAKHRLYRDRGCISALEDFLANVARHGLPTKSSTMKA